MEPLTGGNLAPQRTLAFALLAVVALAAGMAAPPDLFSSLYAHTSILALHLLVELFAVVIAMLVVVISWNDFNATKARSSSFLICGFLIVALCDVFHALTYEGMPALLGPANGTRAIFFWLMGRTAEVITLALMAAGFAPALSRRYWLGAGLAISAVLIWFGSYQIDAFPVTFVKGSGITPFKAAYEYGLCALNLVVALVFWRRARVSGESRDYLLCLSSAVMGLGEIMFTNYMDFSDFQTFYGHGFKLAAYGLLFRATIVTSIRAPFDLIQQSKAQLRESKERWKFAVEGARDGVWDTNLQTGVTLYSKRYEEMMGYAEGELQGRVDGWLERIHPDDRAAVVAVRQAHIQKQSVVFTAEYRMRRKDGDYRWFLVRGMVISRDAQGDARRMIGTCSDISERKRAEAELQEHRIHLERLVEERTAALYEAKTVAEAANMAKSQFLAAASHDLRQPVAALSLYLPVLAGKVAPAEQKIVASMKECVTGLSGLLNDLLSLSKLSAGVVKANVEDFAIAQLFDSLQSVHQPVAESRGLRLRCVPAKIAVRTDPVLLQRIIGNFIDNALRYSKRGGVVVGCRRRHGQAVVEVWDSGIGIPPDKISAIFEEFRQLGDGARNSGSGLGLAIAGKTAALLGLAIQVRSRLGKGSVFAIAVPLGEAETFCRAAHKDVYRAKRIALVEDNDLVREAIVMAMQQSGHHVVSAASGAEVLTALGTETPDVVVTDYRLAKGMTGFDVISMLKSRFGETLPALLITGDTDPVLLREMNRRGVAMLHKPLDIEDLQTHLERISAQFVAQDLALC